MIKLSQLISLPLINLYNLTIEGYIENTLLNPERKKLEQLIVYNENEDCRYVVNYSDIYKIGKNCVFITNYSKITLFENMELTSNKNVNPFNAECYSFDGEYIGKINEIYIQNGQINSMQINNTKYDANAICGINNNLVILSQNKKINLKRFKHSSKRINVQSKNITNIDEPVVTIFQQNTIAPSREITNYNFLLNRLILKDIKNQSGEVIANKNTLVTATTIQKLKYYGKIKELMFNSKNY